MTDNILKQKTGTDDAPRLTLPAQWYHDPDIYERERRQIFAKEWLLFGHESMAPDPGTYIARTIAGWPLLVIRGQDGALKGFHNVCRHRASMIVEDGIGKTAALRCMYHSWVYDMDGQLKMAPGFCEDDATLCSRTKLFSIHLEIWNGLIFVCLADDAPDFKAALGDLPAVTESVDFTAFHYHDMATHTIGCNWKTYVENYSEGYHIPYVHPGLNKEVDFKTYRVVTGDKIAQHLSQPREHRKDDAINDGLWVWHWPYAALNVYRNGMNLELMVPTGPEQTTLYYYYLFKDLADKEANDRTMAMSREVTDEDRKICEIVQKNLRAGVYTQGELSPRHEGGVAYFQDLVREKVK